MAAVVDLQLPSGFRFHPTDEELVIHYLCRKCASLSIDVSIIAEIDLYKYDPWDLPGLALYGEKEWYFFSPRLRKYPNGTRPNRTAGFGYWKATGADKPIGNPKPVGIKKALVFYSGKAPRGEKTNWIMHEYRLADVDRKKNNGSLQLDEYVLCRIYNKKGTIERQLSSQRSTRKPTTTEDDKKLIGVTIAPLADDDFMFVDAFECNPGPDIECSFSEDYSPEFERLSKPPEFPFDGYLDLHNYDPVDETSGFSDYISKPFEILV